MRNLQLRVTAGLYTINFRSFIDDRTVRLEFSSNYDKSTQVVALDETQVLLLLDLLPTALKLAEVN